MDKRRDFLKYLGFHTAGLNLSKMQPPKQPEALDPKLIELISKGETAFHEGASSPLENFILGIHFAFGHLSAPASPVEEKRKQDFPEKLNKWLDNELGSDAADKLKIATAKAKPSPVIEIGEQKGMQKANPAVILSKFLWVNMLDTSVVGGSLKGGFSIDQDVLLKYLLAFQEWIYTNQTFLAEINSPASHPAPAPIVGEREEKKMKCEACAHQLSDHNKEGSDVHCGKGHWYGLDDPNTPYPADFDFWHNCEDFASTKPAPIKQALPEETEEKINKSIEWCQGFERATLKFKSLLDAANARIKELQEWHDSHL